VVDEVMCCSTKMAQLSVCMGIVSCQRKLSTVVLSSQASLLDLNPCIDEVCSVSSLKLDFVFVKSECYWIEAKHEMAVADRFGMICSV
jgi:hypothetical protein